MHNPHLFNFSVIHYLLKPLHRWFHGCANITWDILKGGIKLNAMRYILPRGRWIHEILQRHVQWFLRDLVNSHTLENLNICVNKSFAHDNAEMIKTMYIASFLDPFCIIMSKGYISHIYKVISTMLITAIHFIHWKIINITGNTTKLAVITDKTYAWEAYQCFNIPPCCSRWDFVVSRL